jgi:hypothetical protein
MIINSKPQSHVDGKTVLSNSPSQTSLVSTQSLKVQDYSIAIYNPLHEMGMRTTRHVFRDAVKRNSMHGLPHTEECAARRLANLEHLEEKIQTES